MSKYSVFIILNLIIGAYTEDTDMFVKKVDDIFSSVIGPVFNVRTPHSINNITRTDKPKPLNLRTFNYEPLDDEILDKPISNPKEAQINKTIPTRNYATKSTGPRLTPQAPKPTAKHDIYKAEDRENINKLLYPNPRNEEELAKLLEQPVHTRPDFKVDVIKQTTERFNELHVKFQKWAGLDTRRQAGYRQDPHMQRVRANNQELLQQLANHHKITGGIPEDLINLATNLYYQDRRALERSLALMAQFIYSAQYKFIYAQHLKEKYAPVTKFRIGYSFAVLDNLKFQFNNAYHAISFFKNSEVKFAFEDEVMYLIKVYERCINIQVEYNDIIEFIRDLEYERIQKDLAIKEKSGQKDNF